MLVSKDSKRRNVKMKSKKCLTVLTTTALSVLTVLALCSMAAQSVPPLDTAPAGYACKITRANAGLSDSYVKLTTLDGNPCFALKWFRLPKEQASEMMDKATQALRGGQPLYVHVDVHEGVFPQIQTLGLNTENTSAAHQQRGLLQICQTVGAKCRALL